jgi:hypothetical protein
VGITPTNQNSILEEIKNGAETLVFQFAVHKY